MTEENKLPVSREQFEKFMKDQVNFQNDREYFYQLIQGVEHWNKWFNNLKNDPNYEPLELKEINFELLTKNELFPLLKTFREIDLSNCTINKCHFHQCDLSGATFNKCKMSEVTFTRAILNNTSFYGSNLDQVDFYDTKSSKIIFHESKSLKNINFEEADYKEVNFRDCVLKNVYAINAKFDSINCIGCEIINSDFSESIFRGSSNFNNSKLKNVKFINSKISNSEIITESQDKVIFNESSAIQPEFKNSTMKNVDFQNTKMLRCNFNNSNFSKCKFTYKSNFSASIFDNTTFKECEFEDISLTFSSFIKSKIIDSTIEVVNLNKSLFINCFIKDCLLKNVTLSSTNWEYATFQSSVLIKPTIDKNTKFEKTKFGDTIFDTIKKDQEIIEILSKGLVNNIQFFNPVFGRKVRDEAWLNAWRNGINNKKSVKFKKFTILNKTWNWLRRPISYYTMKLVQFAWWISSFYGRNIVLWAMWSAFIAILFGFLFNNLGTDNIYLNDGILDKNIWTYMYYSVVTFTTLGFGDITPITNKGMFYVASEVVLGYIMLGGLISILANKLARRND